MLLLHPMSSSRSGPHGVDVARLEYRTDGDLAVLEITPQGDRQTACERDDTDAPHPLAGTGKALVEPVAELAAGLQARPAPRELDHQPATSPVARLADTEFNLAGAAGAAGVRRGRQAQTAGHFAAVAKLPPAEQFPDERPRAACTDAGKLCEQRHAGMRAAAHLPLLLHFEQADLLAYPHEPLTFAVDLGAQTGRQQLALTGPPVRPDAAADRAEVPAGSGSGWCARSVLCAGVRVRGAGAGRPRARAWECVPPPTRAARPRNSA